MPINKRFNLLYSIYTGEYPNQFAGGPNNIIYKLIQYYEGADYIFDYLSSDLYSVDCNKGNLEKLSFNCSSKKKFASYLTNNSDIYRKITSSDLYLPYHFYKKDKYFRRFKNSSDRYDIIHNQDSVSLALLINQKFSKARKVITVHNKGPLSDEYRKIAKSERLQNRINKLLTEYEKESIQLADIITFPSFAAKKYFEESLNVELNNEKVKIIYNGVDFKRISKIAQDKSIFQKYSIKNNNDRLILLNIAAHGREKKIDVLLKTINFLVHKLKIDVLLLNVGIGAETDKLLQLVDDLNIQKNVKFLGKLPNDEVIKLMKATDIFIMTSEKVIFDLVVLEALACGTCCIVSNDGGNKETIKDGENGYFIDTNDIEGIAKKIISINPDKVKVNAIETAKQFTVQKMVNEYFEVYESLLNEA